MGDTVERWRMAIGGFYNCSHGICLTTVIPFRISLSYLRLFVICLALQLFTLVNFACTDLHITGFQLTMWTVITISLQKSFAHRVFTVWGIGYFFILIMLLLLSGDIETNPGPNTSNGVSSLAIYHQNIRSIRNKMEYISDNWIDFDILCFTESHLSNNVGNYTIQLETFNFYRNDRGDNSGGIIVYVSESVLSKRLLQLEDPSLDMVMIEVRSHNKIVIICTIYRPPNSGVQFWDKFNGCIERALDHTDNFIIVGDINEDQLNPTSRKFKELLMINNLVNIINEPTRVTPHSATLIDPIAISNNISVSHSCICHTPSVISDHFGELIFIEFETNVQECFKRQVWNYKRGNYVQLNNLICNYDWSFIQHYPVDEACNKFTDIIIDLSKQCIPTHLVTIRPRDKPWYDSEIRKASRQRDRQRKKALQTRSLNDFIIYKQLRNKVNNLKKHAKGAFFENLEMQLHKSKSNNQKAYWKTIKMLIKNESGTNSNIPPLKRPTQSSPTLCISDKEKANCLNDFFSSISSINSSGVSLPDNLHMKTNKTISNIAFNEQDIIDVLSNLATNKSTGPDGISQKILKETRYSISKPLLLLFKRSFNEGVYPRKWKFARVMPLFKKGDKTDPSNYRPISLISCVGKVMERVIFKHIYNYLNDNKLLYRLQSGFQPQQSTSYQLIDIYHQLSLSYDKKESSCIVFCDISKAFDRVWHDGLIFKLRQYGIIGKLNIWIKDYLSERHQSVFVGSEQSTEKYISAGVPQGSVLGPLLFLIYVNDMPENINSTMRLFADDSSMAICSSNLKTIETALNKDLSSLLSWSRQWLVNFNPNKTEAMFFSSSIKEKPKLVFDNTQVKFVDTHKHLGVTLSSDLKWHEHITSMIKSASSILNSMRALKFKLKRDTLNHIYVTYMRPILEYASVVWDGCTDYEKLLIDRLELDAARIVTGLTRSTSTELLLKEIGWLQLSERRKYQKLVMVYKSKNNLLPQFLMSIFPEQNHLRNTYSLRNQDLYTVLQRRTELFSKSFIPSATSLWNSLDPSIRSAQSLTEFKNKLKHFFINRSVPKHFLSGDRQQAILHARLRNKCSNLNADLFSNHLRHDSSCSCGHPVEDAEHFFFTCPNYNIQRHVLFHETRRFHPLNVTLLLHGSETLNAESNKYLFDSVQKFVRQVRRF